MKAIALVEWNWAGHHPTYFAHFVLALEQLDARLLALCPAPEETEKTVAELRQTLGVRKNGMAEFRKFDKAMDRRFLRGPVRAIDRTIRHFRSIEQLVRQWKNKHALASVEIFYACIYDWDFEYFRLARPFLSLPWSGLYIRPTVDPGKGLPDQQLLSPHARSIFRDKRNHAIAVLNEKAAGRLQEETGKNVLVFPDITDERMPRSEEESTLANRLRTFARQRATVGLFGHLQPAKGVTSFCSVAKCLPEICFAIGGKVDWHAFSPTDHDQIIKCASECENVWTHFARIVDEPTLNAVLDCCDVLFGAYIDFPHSSNLLTKAALLKKPVIVSDGSLMADRVREFKLGEVVPQEDVDAIATAVRRITRDRNQWIDEHRPRWDDYATRHSFGAVKNAFAEILARQQ